MNSEELRDLVVEALEDLKARDVKVLDVRHLTTITDYMIIASGTSDRQIRALADNVIKAAKKNHTQPLGVEGHEDSEWVLVDLGDVLVNIMNPPTRAYYQLEKLWAPHQRRATAPL